MNSYEKTAGILWANSDITTESVVKSLGILTKKKIIIQKGFFTSEENEILLYRVTDITLKRTFWQKIFGLGTLIVYAHDKTNPTLEIKNIKHIREYKDALSEAVEKDRIRMKMRQSEIVDGAFDPIGSDSDGEW